MDRIVEFLQQEETNIHYYLKKIVEHESPSNNKILLDQLAEWISATFEDLAEGHSTLIKNDHYGNHVRCEWGDGERQILVLAHFDTVWPKGTLERKPFLIKDGKAYGPGVFDMKGGIVQGIFALKALKQLSYRLNKKVVFLFNSDEEIGSPNSKKIIQQEAKKSEFTFVLEPGSGYEGSLKTFRKGAGKFKVEITGIPAHSGIDPTRGASAIEELAHQTLYLCNVSDLEEGTTLNVGKIQGGTAFNVVAEKASAEVDLRATSKKELDRVISVIKNLKPKLNGTNILIGGGLNRYPLERTQEVVNLFKIAQELSNKYLSFNLTEQGTGGFSDGNFASLYSPTLDGLGAVGDGAHANHEHILVNDMFKRSALFAMLLLRCGR